MLNQLELFLLLLLTSICLHVKHRGATFWVRFTTDILLKTHSEWGDCLPCWWWNYVVETDVEKQHGVTWGRRKTGGAWIWTWIWVDNIWYRIKKKMWVNPDIHIWGCEWINYQLLQSHETDYLQMIRLQAIKVIMHNMMYCLYGLFSVMETQRKTDPLHHCCNWS